MPEYRSGQYLAPSKDALARAVMDPSIWVPLFEHMPTVQRKTDLPLYFVTITSLSRTSGKRPSNRSAYTVVGEDALGRTFAGSVMYEVGRTPTHGDVMVINWDKEPKPAVVDGANDSDARDTKEFVGGTCVT